VVRDGEAVWTGSANWTEDSWTREENVVAFVSSPAVAAAYERDFEDLWSSGRVEESGAFTPDPDPASGMRVRFAPGRGRQISHRVAVVLAHARRIRIASPVITAGPILGTLAEIATAGSADIAGVFDATQMREVLHQWRSVARMWKVQALATVVRHAPFGGKVSTPFGPGTVHDYMHAKVVVADDTVFLGSYNLSHAGEDNAENVIEIRDGTLAARMADFIDGLRARYPAVPLPLD
jgi:phosphatidylserine/phosphatidylglycerophosphate/cardiolipin synthase-like enzyme